MDSAKINIALKILDSLKRSKKLSNDFWVEAYCNGREQGFCIKGYKKGFKYYAAFSENRNSDDIVVYSSINGDVDNTDGNKPTDIAYNNRRYFRNTRNAGAFIRHTINEFVKMTKENEK